MKRTIEIIVAPNGQTRVETKGFADSECQQASKFLEEALGQRTAERLTSEFHQTQETTQENQQQT